MADWLQAYGPYLLIPFISAFVGWITNVLALRMTFHPVEYVGLGPWIGWQGIIPSRAASMAEKSVDLMLGKLIDLEEQFNRIDPAAVAERSRGEMLIVARNILDRIMNAQARRAWGLTPEAVKAGIAQRVADDLPPVVESMMRDLQENVDDIFDVKSTVIQTLIEDKALLNEIFLRCGEREFRFIERSGLYFGFLFGLIQTAIWYVYDPWWLLPLAGGFVGYITNFLAIKLIFSPVRAKRIGPWTVQGLFIKRQREVAAEYASVVSDRVLNTRNIFDNILYGKNRQKLVDIIVHHVEGTMDRLTGELPVVQNLAQSSRRYTIAKNIADYYFINHFPIIIHQISGYAERALRLEETFFDRMSNLPPEEFQGFLRPVFQEDEWKLILVGAVLGAIAGALQAYLLF